MNLVSKARQHQFLSPIEEVIEDARNGRMFILVDAEERENEGDLVIPAQMATPDAINFMAKHGRGPDLPRTHPGARQAAASRIDVALQSRAPFHRLYRVHRGAGRGLDRHFGA